MMAGKSIKSGDVGLLGIDQHGHAFLIDKHPRKELMEQIGSCRADKMYVDLEGGGVRHVGYVIGGLWVRIFRVSMWKGVENEG